MWHPHGGRPSAVRSGVPSLTGARVFVSRAFGSLGCRPTCRHRGPWFQYFWVLKEFLGNQSTVVPWHLSDQNLGESSQAGGHVSVSPRSTARGALGL